MHWAFELEKRNPITYKIHLVDNKNKKNYHGLAELNSGTSLWNFYDVYGSHMGEFQTMDEIRAKILDGLE